MSDFPDGSGEALPEKGERTINYLYEKTFPVSAEFNPNPLRTIEMDGRWLTSETSVVVIVHVPGGKARLGQNAALRYQVNGNDDLGPLSA